MFLSKLITVFLLLKIILICNLVSCVSDTSEKRALERLPKIYKADIVSALEKSRENKKEILSALEKCPDKQLEALGFLLANMPERDLSGLTGEFILKNINLAYSAMDSVQWSEYIPHELFLNYIVPYVSLHERRDDWREEFFLKFLPLVRDLESSGEAVVKLNNEIWDLINVNYSTKRRKADQSPYESMESGLASCTGLSIILIDACRSVGIPARFVGVPLWADHSGNHSWVEIWDEGWHFIGAGEPGPLDQTWFAKRAELSNDQEWKYSIYASSFKKTNVIFPPLFDSTATYVYADIITNRYSKQIRDDDHISLAVRLFEYKNGARVTGKVTVLQDGNVLAEGYTRDEKRDYNDFLILKLQPHLSYDFLIEAGGQTKKESYTTGNDKYQFYEVYLKDQ